MIRVLQIVPTLGYGGVAQFLLNYYKKMDKKEIVFDFVTHGGKEDFHEGLMAEGSNIFYFGNIGKIGLKRYIEQLKIVLTNNQFDVIHTHDGHLTGFTAFLCKQYFRGPVICHAHTTLCVNPKHRPFMPVLRWMSRYYGDILLGCGTMACKYLFGKNSDFTVIHNAVSLKRFQNIENKDVNKLKKQLNIPNDGFVIGHVGFFSYPKNHEYLIRIFCRAYRKRKDAYLVLVGIGSLMDDVRKQCEDAGIIDRVRFVGKQSNIPLYMGMFDAFALPSRWEGLPVVGIEAQAAGLHCVMSETVDHDVDVGLGLVDFLPVTSEYLNKWVEKLFESYTAPADNEIERAFVREGYEITVSINSLIEVYKSLSTY